MFASLPVKPQYSPGPITVKGVEGLKQISLSGHTVLPGFIDCHVHAYLGDDRCMSTSLQFGITTVLDMHNETENVHKLKALASDPQNFCSHADFKSSGLSASIDGGYPFRLITDVVEDEESIAAAETWVKLKGPEEADEYVLERIKNGSDYIKLLHESGGTWGWKLPVPTLELQKAIVDAAHSHELKCVTHAMACEDILEVIQAGVDGLAHTFCDMPITARVVEAYKATNAWVCPTLSATGSMTSEGVADRKGIAHDDRVKSIVGQGESDRICACMGVCYGRGKPEYAVDSIKVLKNAGIDIVCGSDSVGPSKPGVGWGVSFHHELQLFVKKVGMTLEQALMTATSIPAKRFSFQDRGLIQPGKTSGFSAD